MDTEFSLKFIDQLRAFEANNFQLVESISRAESQLETIYKQRKELQDKQQKTLATLRDNLDVL